jgi:SAM-dependent methyltransferase
VIESYHNQYEELWLHRRMLRDHVRNEAYRQAILETVKPGDAVLDVGAGTGILSVFAAQAGARIVHAVEPTSVAEVTRLIAERNGVGDRIEVFEGDIDDFSASEAVDVIVSEWMGGYGVDENMLALVITARDRWLASDGKMLPERVTSWMAPAWDSWLGQGMDLWRSQPHGVDLSPIAEELADEVLSGRHRVSAEDLLAEPQVLWTHDAYTCSLEQARSPFVPEQPLVFRTTRQGKFSALAAWFKAEFGNGVELTNAPDAPATHWGRTTFPLNRTLDVEAGETIKVDLICVPAGAGYCNEGWSVCVGEGSWEHHGDHRTGQG